MKVNAKGNFIFVEGDTTSKGIYSSSGATRVTVVSGTVPVGVYAADGSLNVVSVSPTGLCLGPYHPSGALRVVSTSPLTGSGTFAPNGAMLADGLVATRFAATLGRVSGANADGGNDAVNTQQVTRTVHRTGINGVTGLRVVQGNFKLLGTTPFGEIGVGNALVMRSNIEYLGANTETLWSAATSKSVADLSIETSDPSISIPANTLFYIRNYLTVADVTKKWPRAQTITQNSQRAGKSTDSSAAYAATGANSTGTTDAPFPPIALLGTVPRSTVSVLYTGTSIEDNTGDLTTISTDGAVSYIGRGLENVNGFNLPTCKVSRSGEVLKSLADATTGALRRSLFQYATHIIIGSCTNDITAGDSLATIQGYLVNTIWPAAKANKRKVYQVNCVPRCGTSTDVWLTTANMTPTAGFEVGGIRDQFNAWILTKVADGTIDGVIDFNVDCADPVATDRWRVDQGVGGNTTDGVHPQSAIHTLGATRVRALASTWTAF